jgi:DNA-binding response OmpR family regulator
MEPISVLLIDDNPTFLRATTQFLEAHDDMSVVGTALQGEMALAQLSQIQPQVILVDMAMIGLSGLEVIPRLRAKVPQAGIIALTLLDADHFRQAALKSGADDFVPKAAMRTDLLPTIRRVARNGSKATPETHETISAPNTAAPRILVLEDNPDLCRLYGKALDKTGYQVYTATSIDEAKKLLNQHRFDIWLCDIHVGNDRGTDLLREYAATLATSGTQVIMVSGQAQYRGICEELGIDFFLEKPVAISTLVALVSRLTPRGNTCSDNHVADGETLQEDRK